MERGGVWIAAAAIAGLLLNGCWAQISETRVEGLPHAAPHEAPRRTTERQERPPIIYAQTKDDAVWVKVQDQAACREVTTTPRERIDRIERKVSQPATQYYNAIGAAVLVGVGAYAAFGKCTSTEGGSEQPCSAKEKDGQQAAGYVLMATAAIPLAFLVANMVRATDAEQTVRVNDNRHEDSWKTCDVAPARDRRVAFVIGGVRRDTITGTDGTSSLELSSFESFGETVPSSATVSVEGAVSVEVAIGSTPSAARWAAQVRQAAQERTSKERAAAETKEWTELASDLDACRGPTPTNTDADSVERACARVSSFIDRFPDGSHAAEARPIAAAAKTRVEKVSPV